MLGDLVQRKNYLVSNRPFLDYLCPLCYKEASFGALRMLRV